MLNINQITYFKEGERYPFKKEVQNKEKIFFRF